MTSGDSAFLIDTPPELREACIEYGISKVNAVVLTHAHMDHVAGFDDVRRFNSLNGTKVECAPDAPGANGRNYKIIGASMKCFAMHETIEAMHRIFPYISNKPNEMGLFRPMINFVEDDTFAIGGVAIKRVPVEHGFPCCGYRLEENGSSIGYVSDCHVLSESALELFRGVDVMVLNCLRERPHPTHLNVDAALGYLDKIGAKCSYLIHMCHDFLHAEWLSKLPAGIEPAYDGLELEL